jgi:hypothetical protein
MPKKFTKINSSGHFCEFPGVTIVAAIHEEQVTFWKKIYQAIANEARVVYEQLQAKINGLLLERCSLTVQLNPPKVCYFHDMTKFTPWNGETDPFTSTPPYENARLFPMAPSATKQREQTKPYCIIP